MPIQLTPFAVELRAQGRTLQEIADHFGVSKSGVSRYLAYRAAGRPTRATPQVRPCRHCGAPYKPRFSRKGKFCSSACYHAWVEAQHETPFVQWRQGQRVARKTVAAVFPLEPQQVVHHEDRNNRNNELSNLWVFASNSDHLSYHKGGEGQPIWRGDLYQLRRAA